MTAQVAATSRFRLFDDDFLRRLERLRLVVRRGAPGGLRGEHRARRRGRGMEFCDYREYVPGDDMRDVDWLAYLRFDKLLLRLFEEEGDLPIYILLDASRSMGVPDLAKLDQARRLVAALAYIGLAQEDRVSMVAFGDGARERLDGMRGTGHLLRMLAFLERLEPAGGTDIATTVKGFFSHPRRRGLVILASDFLVEDEEVRSPRSSDERRAALAASLDWLAALRHEVLALHTQEPMEIPALSTSRWLAVDAETGEGVRVDGGIGELREYERLAHEHADELRATCQRRGWSYVAAPVDEPFDDLVLRLFRQPGLLR